MNERIEQAAREYCNKQTWPNDGFDELDKKECVQDFIAGATYALSHQWISVDEELPPHEEKDKQYSIDVIVRCYDETSTYNDYAYYDFLNEVWCSLTRNCSFGPVTHWMEIPEIGGEE